MAVLETAETGLVGFGSTSSALKGGRLVELVVSDGPEISLLSDGGVAKALREMEYLIEAMSMND
jgi:hypothetical protein